jgi:hypothetical protein
MRGTPLRRPVPGLLALLLLVLPACAQEPAATAGELWDDGVTFSDFLADADRRVEAWNENYERGRDLTPELLETARQIPGSWRLLVVAEDYCGDSANTVPYVAGLADALDNLDIRVVDSRAGSGVMDAFQTPDGRGATPTMVLLNDQGEPAGCLVEQPRPLQEWWLGEAKEIEDRDERYDRKYAWYDEDAGASTTAEIVEIMAGAAAGTPVCRPWEEGSSES